MFIANAKFLIYLIYLEPLAKSKYEGNVAFAGHPAGGNRSVMRRHGSLTTQTTRMVHMATDTPTTLLDIEQLNALATRLRDDYVDVRNPGLAKDLDTAADVASEHAHYRFVIAEVADALRFGNPAKKELLELIGKEG
jgi:hypothetical protein